MLLCPPLQRPRYEMAVQHDLEMQDQLESQQRYKTYAEDKIEKLREEAKKAKEELESQGEQAEAAVREAAEKAKAAAEAKAKAELEKQALDLKVEFRREKNELMGRLEAARAESEARSREASALAAERSEAIKKYEDELARAAKAAEDAKAAARAAEQKADAANLAAKEAEEKSRAEAAAKARAEARAKAEEEKARRAKEEEEAARRGEKAALSKEVHIEPLPEPPVVVDEKSLRTALNELTNLKKETDAAEAAAAEAARKRQEAYLEQKRLGEESDLADKRAADGDQAKEAAALEVRKRFQDALRRYEELAGIATAAASKRDRLARQKTQILAVLEEADRENVRAIMDMSDSNAAAAEEVKGGATPEELAAMNAQLAAESAALLEAKQQLETTQAALAKAHADLEEMRLRAEAAEALVANAASVPPASGRVEEEEEAKDGVQDTSRGIFTSSADAQKGFGVKSEKAMAGVTEDAPIGSVAYKMAGGKKAGAGSKTREHSKSPDGVAIAEGAEEAAEENEVETEMEKAQSRPSTAKTDEQRRAEAEAEISAIDDGAMVTQKDALRRELIMTRLLANEIKAVEDDKAIGVPCRL